MAQGENFKQPGIQNDWSKQPLLAKRLWLLAGMLLVIFLVLVGWFTFWPPHTSPQKSSGPISVTKKYDPTKEPTLAAETVLEDLHHVWDAAFLPSGEMLFTQRTGVLSMLKNGQKQELATIDDVLEKGGEGGLLGLAVDPNFSDNRYVYTCFDSTKGPDVRVVRWTLDATTSKPGERKDIVTGIPINAPGGRHSGCRLAFAPDGYLWVATGDAAMGKNPQDPKGLGGKILRVDRDGEAALGNLGGNFDPRIYSYGHRNSQGIAFFKEPHAGLIGISAEHGPDKNDEINPLKPGNFGWDPQGAGEYDESVAMTDKQKFPEAIDALWSSGTPTQAPSGATVIYGEQWQAWNGALAVAFLKGSHLKILQLDDSNKVTQETKALTNFGRLRFVVEGPDGNLYIGTDNGDNDKIIRVKPGQ